MKVKLTKPFNHVFDSSKVLFFLFLWICVIIPQETNSTVCLQIVAKFVKSIARQKKGIIKGKKKKELYLSVTKIEVDGFRMPDVKDAIGLRRETSSDLKEL